MILWGEKVKLIPIEMQHIREMMQWEKHTDVLFADYNFPQWNEKEMKRWLKIKTGGNRLCFSIFSREGEMIGYLALRKINPILKTGEMGILLRPSALGKHYGRDAIYTFLKWAFQEKSFRRVRLMVARYNKRAIACYQAVGFHIKRQVLDICYNDEINPFEDENLKEFSSYFQQIGQRLLVEYYEMEICSV